MFNGKTITVMGIGLHGGALAVIKFLSKNGAKKIIATDNKKPDELIESLKKIKDLENVELFLGGHREEDFKNVDMVIKNPTVPWNNHFIQIALENNVPVEMDSSLFFRLCPTKNIIGITGTKGKTTTSLLIAEILEKSGKRVVRVGVGQESVLDKLEILDENSWVVFELSSWRLSALEKIQFSPKFALITNLYPDHLNHYKDFQAYVQDKKNIYLFQKESDFLAINAEDSHSISQVKESKAQKILFAGIPSGIEKTVFLDKEWIKFSDKGRTIDLMPKEEVRLSGSHNLRNIMGAIAVALCAEISPEKIRSAIGGFYGVKYRLDRLGSIEGVDFINDTASTTPEATIAGIEAFDQPIALICGGSDKNLLFDSLAKKIIDSPYVGGVFLLDGPATAKLEDAISKFQGKNRIIGKFDSLEKVVRSAKSFIGRGGIVLFSPGCSSFGMFKNEFDRGEKFIEIFEKMKKETSTD